MSNEPFLGLTMPVFTAFGWAGEEQALTFALDQLEQFVKQLHLAMSREAQTILPHHGLNRETQGVYMARELVIGEGLHMNFHARPAALRLGIVLSDRAALAKALTAIQANHDTWHEGLQSLGDGWELRYQQMEYNPETSEAVHYKDVFKDRVTALDMEQSVEMIDRMAYLNGEDKWLGPIELSKRMNAEFVAAMGSGVVHEIAKEIDLLLPVLRLLNGGVKVGAARKAGGSTRTTKAKAKKKPTSAKTMAEENVESFTYVSTIKPMHLRKGFINMTELHWPFFMINSRTETRPVILKYDGHTDMDSAVWRMMPAERARLVLSAKPHDWFVDNINPDDEVQITARKLPEKKIEIEIALVS